MKKLTKPTLIFGDIHGSTYWKTAVKENPNCRYIFLGDYLDPYKDISPEKLIENLNEIIELKKTQKGSVILLLGNHDLHYLYLDIEPCSRFDYRVEDAAHSLFSDNLCLFSYAFQEDNHIFTHAGISEKWFLEDFQGQIDKNIAAQLNNPYSDQKPALFSCGFCRGGDSEIGGIFWADINELKDPLPGYVQYAGHNRVGEIQKYENNGGKIVFCDCLYNEIYLKLEC